MATTLPPAKDAITVPFFARVRAALDSFSPTERKLAQVVLDYPINLAGYSASELAQLTGVSNATVTRFIRRLGYDSYEEARRTARLEATTSGLPLPSAGIALSPSTPNCALLWQQLQDNLTATLAQIPASTMDAMASALHQAPAIFCVGLQHNHMLARSLRGHLMSSLDKPVYGAPAAGETIEDVLARIAPRDMVVLFALGGIRADMADLCERARKLGAKLICITDTASHAPPSDWLLRCHTTPHATEVRHLTDTSAAQALAYGLAAHTIQWGAIPFELI
ncbi:MurR/RpiR family transcriptional regulator [Comamonas sp. CAH-2]|uniref:MurR/RpiR family transcriptional regulator n=1 Tax=Comamonas sp. CAH-2 TaxID=2605745 RepID=UPI0012AE013B|nr:MurR/RpiR family transcriptional regulator [Comamonas sp. CAH-2]MRT22123.1 MurR/RpiR family transcriptional regulator [Comamonas sp. CAH-2]